MNAVGLRSGISPDERRGEAVVAGNRVDELMHARIAGAHLGVIEEGKLVEPPQREVRHPRTDEPEHQIDADGEDDGEREIDFAGRDHGGNHDAGHHADEQPERDKRGKEQTSHHIPLHAMAGRLAMTAADRS